MYIVICIFSLYIYFTSRSSKHIALELHLPNVCTETPAHNSVFCEAHVKALKEKGFEFTGTTDFIVHCGADPKRYDKVIHGVK